MKQWKCYHVCITAIPLRYLFWFIIEKIITFMNVQIWPSLLSAFTWVLNSTLEKFVTIWWLFSSTKAYILGGYIIYVTPFSPFNALTAYKKFLKNIDRVVCVSLLINCNRHKWWWTKHQDLDSKLYRLHNHDELMNLMHH